MNRGTEFLREGQEVLLTGVDSFMNLPNPRLMTLRQAVQARARLRRAGRKLVLTNGVFDLLHPAIPRTSINPGSSRVAMGGCLSP